MTAPRACDTTNPSLGAVLGCRSSGVVHTAPLSPLLVGRPQSAALPLSPSKEARGDRGPVKPREGDGA